MTATCNDQHQLTLTLAKTEPSTNDMPAFFIVQSLGPIGGDEKRFAAALRGYVQIALEGSEPGFKMIAHGRARYLRVTCSNRINYGEMFTMGNLQGCNVSAF